MGTQKRAATLGTNVAQACLTKLRTETRLLCLMPCLACTKLVIAHIKVLNTIRGTLCTTQCYHIFGLMQLLQFSTFMQSVCHLLKKSADIYVIETYTSHFEQL